MRLHCAPLGFLGRVGPTHPRCLASGTGPEAQGPRGPPRSPHRVHRTTPRATPAVAPRGPRGTRFLRPLVRRGLRMRLATRATAVRPPSLPSAGATLARPGGTTARPRRGRPRIPDLVDGALPNPPTSRRRTNRRRRAGSGLAAGGGLGGPRAPPWAGRARVGGRGGKNGGRGGVGVGRWDLGRAAVQRLVFRSEKPSWHRPASASVLRASSNLLRVGFQDLG